MVIEKTTGKSTVLIGLQYGDEGKARVLDKIVEGHDVVARFNGGANAGHTLKVGDHEIALHAFPSGIFHSEMKLYVGSGCVFNPVKAAGEKSEIESLGIDLENRLAISPNTTLVLPHHLLLDGVHGKGIGTTGNGIGPAYAGRAQRIDNTGLQNLRIGEYFADKTAGANVIRTNLTKVVSQYNITNIDIEQKVAEFTAALDNFEKCTTKDTMYLQKLVDKGMNVFFEGAQSIMLDVVSGTVPFVTSSRTVAAAAYSGGDISLRSHEKTVGVAKAIMSRVGNGPFISEFGGKRSEEYCGANFGNKYKRETETALYNTEEMLQSEDEFEVGIGLRILGHEYGASTKRPRRIGMLDLVMLRQNCAINGVDEIYINKVDCLEQFSQTSLPGIPVVVAYELDGKEIDYMPASTAECERAKPIVQYLPHITQDISDARSATELPESAKNVVEFIQNYVGVPVRGIGVGPERDQFVKM